MKQIRTLAVTLCILTLFCGTCFAEQWEKISESAYVDLDSIKTIKDGHDDIVKYTLKCNDTKIGDYSILHEMANKNKKRLCTVLLESYDAKGVLTFSFENDPKDTRSWSDWESGQPELNEVLKRAK